MLPRFRPFLLLVAALVLPLASKAPAQSAPIALPNTFSTLGGGGAALTAGAACSTGSAQTATDALGDGCPAPLAQFGSDLRGGVAVDPAGNVFIADSANNAVREIHANSGIVTLLAGKGVVCSAKTDSNGDGCPLAATAFSANPRGIATDPFGNVFVAGYGSNLVNVLCNAVSPLCPNTSAAHQVGSMYLVAGCVVNTGSAGTATATAGVVADGGTATPTGSCGTTVSELNQPRGVSADRFGNVAIADTANLRYRIVVGPASFNGVANPMAALIALNPTYAGLTAAAAAGNIYPLLGGFTPPASGAACTTGSTTTALDAYGDGCPYFVGGLNSPSSSAVQAITFDPNGNILISDLSTGRLRVIYVAGSQMAAVITANNPTVTSPVVGSIYSIAGGGTATSTTSPALGKSVSIDTSAIQGHHRPPPATSTSATTPPSSSSTSTPATSAASSSAVPSAPARWTASATAAPPPRPPSAARTASASASTTSAISSSPTPTTPASARLPPRRCSPRPSTRPRPRPSTCTAPPAPPPSPPRSPTPPSPHPSPSAPPPAPARSWTTPSIAPSPSPSRRSLPATTPPPSPRPPPAPPRPSRCPAWPPAPPSPLTARTPPPPCSAPAFVPPPSPPTATAISSPTT